MKKFILDLEFNEKTGASRILVDFEDSSMTNIEINEAIRSGEMLDEVIDQVAKVLGENIASQVRNGSLEAVCLDNHPELKDSQAGILINSEEVINREIKQ